MLLECRMFTFERLHLDSLLTAGLVGAFHFA
jgi:hypothetical protein